MLCQILPGIPYGMNNLTGEQNELSRGGQQGMDRDLLIGYRILLGCHKDVLELGSSSVGAAFHAKGYESDPSK